MAVGKDIEKPVDIRIAIERRLAHLDLPETIVGALRQVVVDDVARLQGRVEVGSVIPQVADLFDNRISVYEPFQAAWLVMYAAIQRLDHLQDGDVEDVPLSFLHSTAARYNFVLGCYVLGSSLLDDLDGGLPPERVQQVRRLWHDMMLRMVAGQQLDLYSQNVPRTLLAADDYQALVRAKTGATYLLAFAAPALLSGANDQTVSAFALVGEIYGTLLQFFDDVRDATTQQGGASLPHVLQTSFGVVPELLPALLYGQLYPAYRSAALQAIENLSQSIQDGIRALFAIVFETQAINTL